MMTHSAMAAVLAGLVMGLGLGTMSACGGDSFQGEIPPCRCTTTGCAAGACPIQIRLDETCSGEFDFAEAMIDGHVETEAITPTQAVVACSKIDPGATAAIVVRGGDWVWPLTERCSTPGETRSLVLQCVEVGP